MSQKENGQKEPIEEEKKTTDALEENDSVFSSASTKPKYVSIPDEELKNLQKEVRENKEKYLRSLADVENMHKRMQKERIELTNYAVENLIVDFLQPIDNLENALKFAQDMSEEVKNWAFGFQMILSQFKDVLTNNGIVPIETNGAHFDPHYHEAVEMIETDDYLPGTIVEVFIRGYKRGDRTIRPARVKVAKAKQKESDKNSK